MMIRNKPPFVYHDAKATQREIRRFRDGLPAFMAQYRASLAPERQRLLDRYELHDVAVLTPGVGSVGRRCFLLAAGVRPAPSAVPAMQGSQRIGAPKRTGRTGRRDHPRRAAHRRRPAADAGGGRRLPGLGRRAEGRAFYSPPTLRCPTRSAVKVRRRRPPALSGPPADDRDRLRRRPAGDLDGGAHRRANWCFGQQFDTFANNIKRRLGVHRGRDAATTPTTSACRRRCACTSTTRYRPARSGNPGRGTPPACTGTYDRMTQHRHQRSVQDAPVRAAARHHGLLLLRPRVPRAVPAARSAASRMPSSGRSEQAILRDA